MSDSRHPTMSDRWIPFDYDIESRDAQPLPPNNDLVWIYDVFYHGVIIGLWDGWWYTWTGSDDISVSHWMPIERPERPNK